jgi:hypothetical protein
LSDGLFVPRSAARVAHHASSTSRLASAFSTRICSIWLCAAHPSSGPSALQALGRVNPRAMSATGSGAEVPRPDSTAQGGVAGGVTVHNARVQLLANLLNTMAGSSFTVGVAAPIAATFFYNPAGRAPFRRIHWSYHLDRHRELAGCPDGTGKVHDVHRHSTG